MYSDILKGLLVDDLHDIIIDHDRFFYYYDAYTGTDNDQANTLLHLVLTEDEKICLSRLLHDHHGWYRNKFGLWSGKLRLIAYTLGFTNDLLSYDPVIREDIFKIGDNITEQEDMLLGSCYCKQKLVTYKTLINNGNEVLKLVRGVNKLPSTSEYKPSSLESWTMSESVAKKFAHNHGYVLAENYMAKDIFVYKKSVFKLKDAPSNRAKRLIIREDEYIVENVSSIIKLESGKNIWGTYELS